MKTTIFGNILKYSHGKASSSISSSFGSKVTYGLKRAITIVYLVKKISPINISVQVILPITGFE